MQTLTLRFKLAAVAAFLAVPALPACAQAPAAAPRLEGRWSSVAPEPMGPFYGTRDFSFSGDRWQITFRAFADAQGRQPLFSLLNSGAFALGGPSPAVAGAWEGIFPQTQRAVVADSPAGVAMFAQMGCQLVVGQPLAVNQAPCGFIVPLMQAMGEYDLVSIRDGQLFFGDRSGDLTKARPDRLTPYPLVRR